MLKAETFRIEKAEREPVNRSSVKSRIGSIIAALAVMALLSGCATSPTEWWRAQATRQDAAARAAVSNDGIMAE